MSPRKRDSDGDFDNSPANEDMQENRGGRKDGSTPDYEKNQSPSTSQEEFKKEGS